MYVDEKKIYLDNYIIKMQLNIYIYINKDLFRYKYTYI